MGSDALLFVPVSLLELAHLHVRSAGGQRHERRKGYIESLACDHTLHQCEATAEFDSGRRTATRDQWTLVATRRPELQERTLFARGFASEGRPFLEGFVMNWVPLKRSSFVGPLFVT